MLYSANTYCTSSKHILSEYKTLNFDDKEVDELLNVIQRCLHCFLRDLVVLAWAHRGCDTGAQGKLSYDFSRSRHYGSVSTTSIICRMSADSHPRTQNVPLKAYLRIGRYRQAKMKAMAATKAIAVARGRSHYFIVSKHYGSYFGKYSRSTESRRTSGSLISCQSGLFRYVEGMGLTSQSLSVGGSV